MRFLISDLIYRYNYETYENLSKDNPVFVKLEQETKHLQHDSWLLHFASGAISGPISRTLTAPIDRTRIEIQVAPKKMTLFESVMYIFTNYGVTGFWRGNGVNVSKVGFEMAVRFGMFDKIKHLFENPDGSPLTLPQRFISGGVAGVLGNFCIYPLDVMKIRIMVNKGEFNSYFDAIVKILKNEGVVAFYRGFVTSSIGMMTYTGIDLTVYELLKNKYIYSTIGENERPPAWKLLLCASVAINCGQFASYPFYLVKARQQAKSTHPSLQSKRLYSIIIYTVKHDGILGLYRGIILTLFKVLPAGVLNYYIYEEARRKLAPYFVQ